MIKSGIKYKTKRDLTENVDIECVIIELENNKQRMMVGSLYRPPNAPPKEFITAYETVLKEIEHENAELIMGLDYNLDLLKSSTHRLTEKFLETNLEHGLTPTIIRPTRIMKSTATLIDNIMVSKKFCGITRSRILIENASDHLTCLLRIENFRTKKNDKINITSRDIREKNITKLKEALQETHWLQALDSNDVNENSEKFHSILSDKIEHFTPIVSRTVSTKHLRWEKRVNVRPTEQLKKVLKTLQANYPKENQ